MWLPLPVILPDELQMRTGPADLWIGDPTADKLARRRVTDPGANKTGHTRHNGRGSLNADRGNGSNRQGAGQSSHGRLLSTQGLTFVTPEAPDCREDSYRAAENPLRAVPEPSKAIKPEAQSIDAKRLLGGSADVLLGRGFISVSVQ